MTTNHRSQIAALALLAGAVLPACQSVAPFVPVAAPEKIPHGCGPNRVLLAMGRPHHEEAKIVNGKTVGYVWMYDDYWWSRDGWRREIGSWDLYFADVAGDKRYVGWRMVTPISASPLDRETRLERAPWTPSGILIEQWSATMRVEPLPKRRRKGGSEG